MLKIVEYFNIPELVKYIFEYLDLESQLNFISCNKFLNYTYSYLIRSTVPKILNNNSIRRKYFDNCTSCYYFSELTRYPRHLKQLLFSNNFKESMKDIKIPNYITQFTFSKSFNLPIENIPNHITHVTLDYWFRRINRFSSRKYYSFVYG